MFSDIETRATRGIDVVAYPHPALRHKAVTVEIFNKEISQLVDIMFEKMYERRGCGLAAPQLGIPFKIFVINPSGDPKKKSKESVFINPIITPKVQHGQSRTYRDIEGCLSIGGFNRLVERYHDVNYEAFDVNGEKFSGTYGGLNARVLQHENDHLEGLIFTDRLDKTQLHGVQEWMAYLETQFSYLLNSKQLPPIEEITKNLFDLEKLVSKL